MAVAKVQMRGPIAGTGASSIAGTWTSNTTTGNLIIVSVSSRGIISNVTGVSDSQSNTYVKVQPEDDTTGYDQELWIANNITGGTTPTVTVSFDGASTAYAYITLIEISGQDLQEPVWFASTFTTPSLADNSLGYFNPPRDAYTWIGAANAGSFSYTSHTGGTTRLTGTTRFEHFDKTDSSAASWEHVGTYGAPEIWHVLSVTILGAGTDYPQIDDVVQYSNGGAYSNSTGASLNLTLTGVTAGNDVFVALFQTSNYNRTYSVSDDDSNTYDVVANVPYSTNYTVSYLWRARDVVGGDMTITVSPSATGPSYYAIAFEVAGLDQSAAYYDSSAFFDGSSAVRNPSYLADTGGVDTSDGGLVISSVYCGTTTVTNVNAAGRSDGYERVTAGSNTFAGLFIKRVRKGSTGERGRYATVAGRTTTAVTGSFAKASAGGPTTYNETVTLTASNTVTHGGVFVALPNLTLSTAQALAQAGVFVANPSISFGLSNSLTDGGLGTFPHTLALGTGQTIAQTAQAIFGNTLTLGTVGAVSPTVAGILLANLAINSNATIAFIDTLVGGNQTYEATLAFAQAMGLTQTGTLNIAAQLSAAISAGIQQIAIKTTLGQLGLPVSAVIAQTGLLRIPATYSAAVSAAMVQSGRLIRSGTYSAAISTSISQSAQKTATAAYSAAISAGMAQTVQKTASGAITFNLTLDEFVTTVATYNAALSMVIANLLNSIGTLSGEILTSDQYLFLRSLAGDPVTTFPDQPSSTVGTFPTSPTADAVITFTANPLGGVTVNITPTSPASTVTDSLKDN